MGDSHPDVNHQLELVLRGEGNDQPTSTVDVQTAHKAYADWRPITKTTVCYIVAGVLINDHNEILLIQEAKRSCHGLWYLPAGRMEPGEHIVDSVKREVLEESGLEFEPTTLLSVEINSSTWYRFSFTGKVTGGCLKTTAQKDAESLQARWFSYHDIKTRSIPLRATDVVHVIEAGLSHRACSRPHPDLLPALLPHDQLALRVVMVHNKPQGPEMHVLFGMQEHPHIPVGYFAPFLDNVDSAVARILKHVFDDVNIQTTINGVLSLEHHGRPAAAHDGICITLLVTLSSKNHLLPQIKNAQFKWCLLEQMTRDKIRERCEDKGLVALMNIR